ncbi:MAG TPA: CHASE4 domain-containing protein [Dehalococcoidales bacterium]
MSFKIKTIIIIAAVAVSMFGVLYCMSEVIFIANFEAIEKKLTEDNTGRIVDALSSQLDSLDTLNHDWAAWDDTYIFAQDRNQDYLDSNTTDQTMINAGLNLIAILDSSGQTIFIKTLDTDKQMEVPVGQSLQDHLANNELVHHEDINASITGIVLLPEGPLMLSSRPIITSNGEGPITGTMIMGCFLDSTLIEMIAETVHVPVTIDRLDSEQFASEFQIARASLSKDMPVFTQAISHQSIVGYGLLEDIYGEPILIARVELPREIHAKSIAALHYFVISILIHGVVFSVLTYLLLSKLIFKRLTLLSQNVDAISASGNSSLRLPITGGDEVSNLTKRINHMLSSLDYSETLVRKSRESLKKQKELVERIITSSPNSVLVLNQDSRVVLANRAFYNTFKKTEEEVEAKPITEVIPEVELSKAVLKAISNKTSNISFEFRHKSNSHEKIFDAHIIQMQEEEVLVILNDVTEERETREKIYLTDRLVSVGEMGVGIAHEINNPLTGIMGLSQLLLDEELSDDVRNDLNAIHSEAQRAATIIKNLLTFARKHVAMKQPLQINIVVADVLKLRAYEHKVNNIRIKTQFDNKLPVILADQFQMQQAFLNIVLNAEQAMTEAHKGGTLTITTERVDDTVEVSFSDDGPGISPENMRKLFTPFFTTKEVGKGTGLGLSVCFGLVTNHDGKISAQSEPGKGATFVVELPINGHQGGGINGY